MSPRAAHSTARAESARFDQPPAPRPLTWQRLLFSFVVFLSIPLTLAGIIAGIQYRLGNQVLPQYRLAQQAEPSPSPEGEVEIQRYNMAYPTGWRLIKGQGEFEDEIFSENTNYHGPLIARWKNWLVLGKVQYQSSNGFENPKVMIMGHNLDTGVTDVWATYAVGAPDGASREVVFNDLMVVDDRLFAAVGHAYNLESMILWMDLDERTKLEVLPISFMPYFEQVGDRYLVMAGNGEGCGGNRRIYTFKPEVPGFTLVTESNEGCVMGNRVIAVRDDDLITTFVAGNPSDYSRPIHQRLGRISLVNGQASELLDTAKMPPNIETVLLSPDQQTVWLFGEQLYRFNLQNRVLSQFGAPPAEVADFSAPPQDSIRLEGENLCFYYLSPDARTKRFVEFSATEERFMIDAPDCIDFKAEMLGQTRNAWQQKIVGEAVDELQLPPEYQLKLRMNNNL